MYEKELKVLQNESTRQLIFEFLVLGMAVAIFLLFVVEPFLLSRFPSIFPEASSRVRAGRYVRPTTRVGLFQSILGALVLGSYMYYRFYFTALGADILDFYDELR